MKTPHGIPWTIIVCVFVISLGWLFVRQKLNVHGPSWRTLTWDSTIVNQVESSESVPQNPLFVKLHREEPVAQSLVSGEEWGESRSLIEIDHASDKSDESKEAGGIVPTTEITTQYGIFYGLPMARFADQYWLLRNDGAIQSIPTDIIQIEQKVTVGFTVISTEQLISNLRDEFGSQYLVQHQSPYIFVAKSQHIVQWGARFRSLHDSMRRVCSANRLVTHDIEFPLVAIVFGSREEFLRYASHANASLPLNCVGYYSQRDNRIALYEDENESTAQETLDTISHETAHQLAFNMGLHRRCVSSGLWLPEGFATLFEAPAFSNISREGRSSWPAARIQKWQEIKDDKERLAETLDSIVRHDSLFTHDPDLAYTVSWALAFHLMEKETRRFADYVHQTSQLPLGHQLASVDRLHHFRSVFGRDPAQFAPLIQKHLAGIR